MQKSGFRIVLLVVFTCLLSAPAFAKWGPTGHRIVAEIADSYLNKKARKAIAEILGDESLAMSANWADFIKSDSTFNYLNSWHYINMPAGLSKEDFAARLALDSATDAYTKLNFLVSELKKNDLPLEKKKMYLRLLIHIAGDIHQPMHVSRAEDQGGNKIKLTWFSEAANLHNLWDDKLVEFQKLSYTEYATAINHVSKTQRKAWAAESISDWCYESYSLSAQLYSELTTPEPKLSFRYNFDHVDMLNRQLLKGGVHLAALLNEIFG